MTAIRFVANIITDIIFYSRSFPDPTPEQTNGWVNEDVTTIEGALLAARLPAVNIPDEMSHPFDRSIDFYMDLDFSTLISLRQVHETQRAKASVRTKFKHEIDGEITAEKEESVRRRIFRGINEVLREDQAQRINTGTNRKTTWTASAPGGRSASETALLAGNSANAELAAGQRALTVRALLITAAHLLITFTVRLSTDETNFSASSLGMPKLAHSVMPSSA